MSEFYLYQKILNQRLRNQDNPAHSCQQCPNCPESPWYQADGKAKKHMLGTHVLTYALRVEQEPGVYPGVLRDQHIANHVGYTLPFAVPCFPEMTPDPLQTG